MKPAPEIRKSRFAFLTLPNYSAIAVSNAVEPLRMANSLSAMTAYEWVIASLDGQPVPASNGLALSPTVGLAEIGRADIVFVCGGINIREAVSPALLAALRRLGEQRLALGALCTGGYALARAGLLDRYRATIHWENLSALREEFPRVLISDQLFTIDRNRYTCSGGVAPLDLMLNLIESKLGTQIAQRVSEQFIVDRIRSDRERQYVPLRAQVGVSHQSLIKVAELMEANIERTLSLERIATEIGPLAAPDRAAVQTPPQLCTEALLPRIATEAGARAAAADGDADHGHHDRLRLPVAAALLQVLPQAVRPPAERRASDAGPRRSGRGRARRRWLSAGGVGYGGCPPRGCRNATRCGVPQADAGGPSG